MSGRPLYKMPSYETQTGKRGTFLTAGAVFKSREGWEQLKGRTNLVQVRLWVLSMAQDKMETQQTSSFEKGINFPDLSPFLPVSAHIYTLIWRTTGSCMIFPDLSYSTVIATQKPQHYQSSQVPCPWSMIRTGHLFFHPQTLPPSLLLTAAAPGEIQFHRVSTKTLVSYK